MSIEKIIETCVANAPLVTALGFIYWKLTPKLIKMTLQNGGGEIVRGIVKAANAEQSKEHAEHFAQLRERLAIVETRFRDHIDVRAAA